MTFDEIPIKNRLFGIDFCAIFLYNVGNYYGEVGALAEVIAFTSGKGGTGKTALCAEIAKELASAGRKVLCIDCQSVYGDLDAYLRLENLPHLTYGEVCTGQYPLEKATAHPYFSNLRFLAASASRETVDREAFATLLRQARAQFDYILLDDPQNDQTADSYVLVTDANPAAIRGARRKADMLEVQGKTNVRLVVNSIDIKHLQVLDLNIDDVMDQVGLPLLGIVPYDFGITVACAQGKNPHSIKKSGAFAAIYRIAQRIQGIYTAIPSRL